MLLAIANYRYVNAGFTSTALLFTRPLGCAGQLKLPYTAMIVLAAPGPAMELAEFSKIPEPVAT